MRVCILFGSPRKEGNTAKLLDAFFEASPENIAFDTFSAFQLNAQPCDDCGYCKTKEACIKHDLDDFCDKLEKADVFVIATPIYLMNFPSPVKAVLDRFQRYYNARFFLKKRLPIEKPKRAFFFATSGADDNEKSFEFMKNQLVTSFSVMNTRLTDCYLAQGLDNISIENDLEKIRELSKSIFN